jgi:hypothetical protein
MRYIPQLSGEVIVQVPEDRNSYINVKNIGASGRGDLEFTGTVTDISDGVVTISSISDGAGGTLFQYADLLRTGVDLQVFSYSSTFSSQPANLAVTGHLAVGDVDFSGSTGINPNIAALTYYVVGYDASTGVITGQPVKYEVKPSTPDSVSRILNPDFWNTEQYVQINFTRTSSFVLPVIYRQWGSRLDFLGVIGNNKVGYPGSGIVSFRDLGDTEYAPWHETPVLPSFLTGIVSASAGQVSLLRRISAKENLRILPGFLGQSSSFIQCSGISQNSGMLAGDTVRFKIDDSRYVQEAINLAASSSIKEVFFPAGVYNIRDTFFSNSAQLDYSSLSIRGVGNGSVLRRLPSGLPNQDNPGLLNFSGPSGLTLRSILMDGNSPESYSLLSPIGTNTTLTIRNTDNLVVSDCTFVDNAGGGVALENCNGLSFTGNRIVRTGKPYEQGVSPLLIDTCENAVVQGNTMLLATTGPRVVSTDFSTVNGNIVRGCGDKGIDLQTSFQWNAQGNLAYSDNDSLISSIDTYNNEYSRATIEARAGFTLDPVFMTVTYGGESVRIAKDSIEANIYQLNSDGEKAGQAGSFRVIQTRDQLDAGIFSLTLPGTTTQVVAGKTIPSTQSLNNINGYVYEVKASVFIGRTYRPFTIKRGIFDGTNYIAVQLRNSSDILSFQIYSNSTTSENDKIVITGFTNIDDVSGWDQTESYTVVGVDPDSNSILLDLIPGSTIGPDPIEFIGGTLSILRPNYFVADGNLIVHTL